MMIRVFTRGRGGRRGATEKRGGWGRVTGGERKGEVRKEGEWGQGGGEGGEWEGYKRLKWRSSGWAERKIQPLARGFPEPAESRHEGPF